MTDKIALLGGGQLGKMFLQEALNFPTPVAVLDPDSAAPCAHLSAEFWTGHFNDSATVQQFVQQTGATRVGIEIEHVAVEALDALAAAGKTVLPAPAVLRLIQDKGRQKQFYLAHNLPTAPFYLVEKKEEIKKNFPLVQKLRTGGYDGKGVQLIHSAAQWSEVWDAPSVIEECCPIAKEIAVVIAADGRGDMVAYPTMEMVFDPALNLVDYVQMPAQLPAGADEQAQQLARRVVAAFGSAGLFAVEMFLTTTGEIWLNETAPRVHNSAHLTIEACNHSQFAQMWRLLAGMPIAPITQYCPAAMVNLIGAPDQHGKARLTGLADVLAHGNIFPHWYGKEETRPGRKIGHVTVLAEDFATLRAKIALVKKHLRVVAE